VPGYLRFSFRVHHSPNLSFTDNELSAQKSLPNHRQFPNKKSRKTGPPTQQIEPKEITTEDFCDWKDAAGSHAGSPDTTVLRIVGPAVSSSYPKILNLSPAHGQKISSSVVFDRAHVHIVKQSHHLLAEPNILISINSFNTALATGRHKKSGIPPPKSALARLRRSYWNDRATSSFNFAHRLSFSV
jgi:hypothetical protein